MGECIVLTKHDALILYQYTLLKHASTASQVYNPTFSRVAYLIIRTLRIPLPSVLNYVEISTCSRYS